MDYTLGDVLREVNNLRFYEFSLPPLEKLPKGVRFKPLDCVIGKCFPNCITASDKLIVDPFSNEEIEHPLTIRLFITDFDNGKWPSLIEKNVSSADSTTNADSQTPSLVAV